MTNLSQPSPDLAARILAEVGFEERLVGVRMTPRAGMLRSSLYAVREVAAFLNAGSIEEVFADGCRAGIGYVELGELADWVGSVFGDAELATRIRSTIHSKGSYLEKGAAVRGFLEARLRQCTEVCQAAQRVASLARSNLRHDPAPLRE